MIRPSLTRDACEQLEFYRASIKLDTHFSIPQPNGGDAKIALREAISALWSSALERTLDIHLPTFLNHFGKDVSTLRQFVQIASQACDVKALTDRAIELIDQAYVLAGTV
jgi:hypothetical protein